MHKEHKIENYCWALKGENTCNRKPLKIAENKNTARCTMSKAQVKFNLIHYRVKTKKLWLKTKKPKQSKKSPCKKQPIYHTINY